MATNTNRTISFETDVLERALENASQAGISLSAYVTRAVRKQTMADALRRVRALDAEESTELANYGRASAVAIVEAGDAA